MGLLQKLAELRKEVTYLQKEAKNSAQGFNYVSSSQVLSAVRGKMDDLGIILTQAVTAATLRDPLQGKKMFMTELEMLFTWYDVETGEKMELPWYGQGADMSEKGVGKAMTYAEKYFILKQLNIATDKDDPDAYEAKQERKASQSQRKETPDGTADYVDTATEFKTVPKTMADGMAQLKGVKYDGEPMASKYKSFVSEMGKFKKKLGDENYYECLKPFKKSIHVYLYQDMVKIFDLMRKAEALL
jgi:hypothetical protein